MQAKLVDELLSKNMTRKEFLLYAGALIVVVTGIAGLLKTIADPQLAHRSALRTKRGFGSGLYGRG